MRKQPRTTEKRRNRAVGFTDAEWHDIGTTAADMRISKARYIVQRVFEDRDDRQPTPDALQLVMLHKAALTTLDDLSAIVLTTGSGSPATLTAIPTLERLAGIERELQLVLDLAIGHGATAYGAAS